MFYQIQFYVSQIEFKLHQIHYFNLWQIELWKRCKTPNLNPQIPGRLRFLDERRLPLSLPCRLVPEEQSPALHAPSHRRVSHSSCFHSSSNNASKCQAIRLSRKVFFTSWFRKCDKIHWEMERSNIPLLAHLNSLKLSGHNLYFNTSSPPTLPFPRRFSWPKYLEHCNAQSVPEDAFNISDENSLEADAVSIGMKLEAEDRSNGWMCVATVADVLYNRILIHFDGWDSAYDQWMLRDSPCLKPVGWCRQNKVQLYAPKVRSIIWLGFMIIFTTIIH